MGAIEDIADNYTQSQVIGLGIGFIILPILAVGLRIWAKLLGRQGVAWDDYLIVAALVCIHVSIHKDRWSINRDSRHALLAAHRSSL